jgi:hypothetical protein
VRVDETLVKNAPVQFPCERVPESIHCLGKATGKASVFPHRCLVGLMLVGIIKRLLRKQSGLDLICKDCTG